MLYVGRVYFKRINKPGFLAGAVFTFVLTCLQTKTNMQIYTIAQIVLGVDYL